MAQQQNAVFTHCSFGPGAPNSGGLYVGATTTGVHVNYPAGTSATFESLASKDFQGGGSIFVRQNNVETAYPNGGGNSTRTQIGCMSLSPTPIALVAGTVIPAPDTSAGIGSGSTSYFNITSAADGLDWIGGFSNTGAIVGMEIALTNNTGNTINIGSNVVGSGPGAPYPWLKWGFRESFRVRYISTNVWAIVEHTGAYSQAGGSSAGGGRVIFTTDATPTILYPFIQGLGGVSFEDADVDVEIAGGGGALYGWRGVSAAWDSANLNYGPLSWKSEGGNAAGIALGARLTIADGGGAHNLTSTGKVATNLRWTINNIRLIIAP